MPLQLMRLFTLIALLAGTAFSASGQGDGRYCLGGPVVTGEEVPVRLLRVRDSEPRTHFVADQAPSRPGCPAAGEACRRRAFLLPGDLVIAGPERNGFHCVSYIAPDARKQKGKITETNGFLPADALAIVPLAPASPADWAGTWTRSEEGEITITPLADGRLRIAGEASFGAFDPGRVRRGAVNGGTLDGEARPSGNRIALGAGYDGAQPPGRVTDGECRARLRLFRRYLVVEDNSGCGGMNVSFDGVYVRLTGSAP